MQFQANVKKLYRTPGVSMELRSKRSIIALSSDPNGINLVIVGCSALGRDINGIATKYPVKDNIQKIITRFINNGLTTISIKNPAIDLLIEAFDVDQLKSFMLCLHDILTGKVTKVPGEITNKTLRKAVIATKMRVKTVADIPKQFSKHWQVLEMSELGIAKVMPQLFDAINLRELDLSGNQLSDIPMGINCLKNLVKLNLSSNRLNFTDWMWLKDSLAQSLVHLDLSNNDLTYFPFYIHRMRKIHTLDLNSNDIFSLPPYVVRLRSLNTLSLAGNNFVVLPSFKHLAGNLRNIEEGFKVFRFHDKRYRILTTRASNSPSQPQKVVTPLAHLCSNMIMKNNPDILIDHVPLELEVEIFVKTHQCCGCNDFVRDSDSMSFEVHQENATVGFVEFKILCKPHRKCILFHRYLSSIVGGKININ